MRNKEQMGGIVPANAIDMEEAIIGAILVNRHILDKLTDLRPEMFYSEQNRCLYEATLNLAEENKPIDVLLLKEELSNLKKLDLVGGIHKILSIQARVSSDANVDFHKAIIIQKYIQRETLKLCFENAQLLTTDGIDPFQVKEALIKQLEDLSVVTKKDFSILGNQVKENIKKIELAQKEGLQFTGLNTGFERLNKALSGWNRSDLIIIGARPGVGKTVYALNFALSLVNQGTPTGIFSLEMSKSQLVNRLISIKTEITGETIKTATLAEKEWVKLSNTNFNLPLIIDDTPALNIMDFKAKARRMKKEFNIEMIFVDYLQLMTTYDKVVREQQIGIISRSLKEIAKELDIPIVALAQLSRDIEKRGGSKIPQLSDLRESGSIEQDADIVMFMHPENSDDNISEILKYKLIIAKHRNGPTSYIEHEFNKPIQKITEIQY